VSGIEREDEIGARARDEQASVVRHEEELELGTQEYQAGTVRARKRVETEQVERIEPRSVEHGDFERAPAEDGDSGEIETLEDGSVSIPLFEERLVVRKELFVRERVILRKRTVTEHHRIETELRKERIEVEGDVEGEPDGPSTEAEPESVTTEEENR
jgi:uncharacterized protein (TIGR02271 family)